MKQLILQLLRKLKVVFGGKGQIIQEEINIEIKAPDNSLIQIALKLKTVFGGKGQIQTTTEIQTEISETPRSKGCSMFNYEMRRLIH